MIFQTNSSKTYVPTYKAIEYNILDEISPESFESMEDDDDLQIYECYCGKKYFSQENYLSHQRSKHSMRCSETMSQKKTEPETKTKINPILALILQNRFFERATRGKDSNLKVDCLLAIEEAFEFVFVKHKELCYSKPKEAKDNNLLLLLSEYRPIQESKGLRKTDNILYEYCLSTKYLTNTKYFKLILQNLLILREFWNKENIDCDYTKNNLIGELPLFCNDLIGKYLLNYALSKAEYKESLKIIHNFFNWLYYNEYSEYVILLKERGHFLLNNSD